MIPSPQEIETMMQPTKLDKFVASIFPTWGAKRIRARREYAYEAAVNTRLRTTAQRLTGPEDYQAFPDRIALIKQVRDLENNFGLWQGIIDKLAMYAFDSIRYQARTGLKERDDEYEEYLRDRLANCDLSGRLDFTKMVEVSFKSMLRDGDFGLKWQRDGEGELKLTGIEGDRIGGIYMTSTAENYFQGIEIDVTTGRPLKYQIYYRNKADAYVNPQWIPANDIIHVFDPRRYNQYRGVTPFAPIINEARDLKELMEALRIGTKFENYHSAVQYTASGLPLNSPQSFIEGTETVNGAPIKETEIKFGVIQAAPIGSKVEWLKSDRPAGTVQTYMENLIRIQGTALNLPFGFLYNLVGLSGPGARMDSQQAKRVIMRWQANMKRQVLDRVKNTYLMEGFAKGAIRFTPKWSNGVWQFPAWPTIDVGRDSAAGINEWQAGLLSKDAWFAENGEDAEEQEEIIEREAERTLTRALALAKRNDVPLDIALTLLESKTSNGWLIRSPTEKPAFEPEPEPVKAPQKEEMQKQIPSAPVVAQNKPEVFVLPGGEKPIERVRRKLKAYHSVVTAKEGLEQRRERFRKTNDALKWLEEEVQNRKSHVN